MNIPHDVTLYALTNRQNRSFRQHVTDRQTDTQHLPPYAVSFIFTGDERTNVESLQFINQRMHI